MKFFSSIAAVLAIGGLTIYPPNSFARFQDSQIGCRAWDPNDTYVNVRRSPNGALVKSVGNGTFFTKGNGKLDPISARANDSQGREWILFNNYGWVLGSLLSCELITYSKPPAHQIKLATSLQQLNTNHAPPSMEFLLP